MFKHTYIKGYLVAEIGGSHLSSALCGEQGNLLFNSYFSRKLDASQKPNQILSQWVDVLNHSLSQKGDADIIGLAIAMPGPFDYEKGICLMSGVNKYDQLFGVNIMEFFRSHLNIPRQAPILFSNDASCFGLGEAYHCKDGYPRQIALTLGTGLGSAFVHNKKLANGMEGVPDSGFLYNTAFKNGIAEDYISTRWLEKEYAAQTGKNLGVEEMAGKAINEKDTIAIQLFRVFGNNLAECLSPWIRSFEPDLLVLGGNISKSNGLFLPDMKKRFSELGVEIPIKISWQTEESAMIGAVQNLKDKMETSKSSSTVKWRKSTQPLLPIKVNDIELPMNCYGIYPYTHIGLGMIYSGFDSLAKRVMAQKIVVIDGYVGNDWDAIRDGLAMAFKESGIRVLWFEASAFLKPEMEVDKLVAPFLGDDNSVWGKKADLKVADFFQLDKWAALKPDLAFDLNIIIGTGSALSNWHCPIIYVDIPKNEIQYRMRAGHITNLGKTQAGQATQMYKRFYFVDWPVLNKYRQALKERIDIVVDGQWRTDINWALYADIKKGLAQMSKSMLRVRPWFEAGAWGGQWMKEHIQGLNKGEINYAWSFELITPENGLLMESDGNLLELSFDWIMELDASAILGRDAKSFGLEFPIRFDFLDTFYGGNLSIQCHPRLKYIQEKFGETITQDETYYILDCDKQAGVYLGFQDDVDPKKFREELELSQREGTPIEIDRYVQFHPSHKHDLFLIPNGTIHSSGTNNLVLEISSTPYIFTFKMYDWVRLDLDGKPRPINIEHAFQNLDFERKGERVPKEHISKPTVIESGEGYLLIHLPTHPAHFYDVHRIEFEKEIILTADNRCYVLMLVEGEAIEVFTENGVSQVFYYAETFLKPAAAGNARIINKGPGTAKLIKAFIK
ncbi:MAG: ROK family protein [Bacteroidetes bacterium]|nr:ROK family protein [Bacteroidota bacterium]